jgi:hypothetical protein
LLYRYQIPTGRPNLQPFISKRYYEDTTMTTHIDTIVGNKGLSEKLTGMLVDLRDTIRFSI